MLILILFPMVDIPSTLSGKFKNYVAFFSVSISWRQGFCCKYYLNLSKVEIFSKTQPGLVGTKSLNDLCIRICFSIQSRISYMKFKNPENCREETVSYGWFEVQFLAGNLPSAWLAVR